MSFEERIDFDRPHPLTGAFMSRYKFVCQLVSDARVLDAACGSGYGSFLYGQAGARFTTGLDLDLESLQYSRDRPHSSGAFMPVQANVSDQPFGREVFDVVVSIETLEHVPYDLQHQCVQEYARVLKNNGVLVLTTPNSAAFGGHSGNPFHSGELNVEQLIALISPHFREVRVFGHWLRRTKRTPAYYNTPTSAQAEQNSHLNDTNLGRLTALRMGALKIAYRGFSLLPYSLQDTIWRIFFGLPYYPSDEEFEWVPDAIDGSPTILLTCRRR